MSENFLYGNGTNRLYGVSDAIDSDSSLTVASSKAIKLTNDKITNIETNITSIESTATTSLAVANNALPKSGGTLTGAVAESWTWVQHLNLDLTTDNNFSNVVSDNITFTATARTGNSFQLGTLILTNGGSHTVTWPSAFKWADGAPPSLMASGIDVITFFTIDGGTTYYAAQVMTGIV